MDRKKANNMSEIEENIPTFQDIDEAHERILPYIHFTPVLTSDTINDFTGAKVWFKCENLQKIGAFKIRGALNAVLLLPPEFKEKGVATHSSGNHAQALARAARQNGLKAYIVMPENAPKAKKNAVIGYGAEVTTCIPTLEARETKLQELVDKTGATFIHPYNNYRVIAGQATAAYELLQEIADLDIIITPIGGGGLISGTALIAHYVSPDTQVIGGEPSGADDAFQSLKAGKIVAKEKPESIADGLLATLGTKPFNIIQKHVSQIITVEEEEIIAAMKMIWERMKIIVEPSASVPLAALLKSKKQFSGKRIGIILSGGNVDLENLPF
ncbi:pyridoxal-phosphate dependent enzyme [soil metagenome]